MSIKIAVPDHLVFNEVVFKADELQQSGVIQLYRVPESQCWDLFYNNRVDAAFLTPLAYSNGITRGDYRIVPGPILALSGFSGVATIHFKEGTDSIKSCSTPNPDDFMMAMGKVLMKERYDLDLTVTKATGTKEELLQKADSAIIWEKETISASPLDITELWSDSFDMPLILGFWVCRSEEFPPNIIEIVYRLWNDELKPEEEVFEPVPDSESEFARDGIIFRQWNEDIEFALDKTIHLMFYHQLTGEIAAIKILGRD